MTKDANKFSPISPIEFDRILSKIDIVPKYIHVHPHIWNGYWGIKRVPKPIRVVFRYCGKQLHNKYLFWVGLPLYWVRGLKEDWVNHFTNLSQM